MVALLCVAFDFFVLKNIRTIFLSIESTSIIPTLKSQSDVDMKKVKYIVRYLYRRFDLIGRLWRCNRCQLHEEINETELQPKEKNSLRCFFCSSLSLLCSRPWQNCIRAPHEFRWSSAFVIAIRRVRQAFCSLRFAQCLWKCEQHLAVLKMF